MPGIPLLNIGTALGGLAGGWNQAQSQGLQQAIQRLALQQQQGLTNQQTLASLAAQAGLLNQAMGGGQTPLGAATGAVPNQSSTPTPGGGVTAPPVSPSSGGGAPPGYAPPLGSSPYFPPGDLSPAGEVMHNPKTLASWQDASGYVSPDASSGSGYVLPGGPVPPASQTASSGDSDATPTPTPTPSPAQSSDSGLQSGGGQPSSIGIQIGNGQVIPLDMFYQRVDYQKLAQGIAQLAPPGTSQADIYGAMLDLVKLSEGDRTAQQQAGLIARALIGSDAKLRGIELQGQNQLAAGAQRGQNQLAAGAQRAQTQEDIVQKQIKGRSDLQAQKDTALDARTASRMAQQKSQFDQKLAQTSRIANTTAKDTQLRALLADIDKQLNPGGFAVPPQGDELLQLQRERVQIVNELRKLQGLPAVPMPQAPVSQ